MSDSEQETDPVLGTETQVEQAGSEPGPDGAEETGAATAGAVASDGGDEKGSDEDDSSDASSEDEAAATAAADDGSDDEDSTEDDEPDDSEDDAPGAGTHTKQPGADPEDEDKIEEERQERLDPDNRPDGAEVDNTDRDFDASKGLFTDSEGYEEAEEKFPEAGDQGA